MWTASITNVDKDPIASIALVTFEYTDSDTNRTKTVVERVSNPSTISQIAMNGINELTRIDQVQEFIDTPSLWSVVLPTTEQQISETTVIAWPSQTVSPTIDALP